MPEGEPFTVLCRALARGGNRSRADLHAHTTHSDGLYTPAEAVDLARRTGLAALAITDHDTTDGIAAAITAAGSHLEIVPGVEVSTSFQGREIHLLAYFVRTDDPPLRGMLERLRRFRVGRFQEMIDRLRVKGVRIEQPPATSSGQSLGRRHLAELLVSARRVGTVREAFQRYLRDGGPIALPKTLAPVEEALALVRAAGGVASWAHPAYDCTRETLNDLAQLGLGAVEAEYPTLRPSRRLQLRAWARELGLGISGGSDCHGPEPCERALGACTISLEELALLRHLATPVEAVRS